MALGRQDNNVLKDMEKFIQQNNLLFLPLISRPFIRGIRGMTEEKIRFLSPESAAAVIQEEFFSGYDWKRTIA